MVNLNLILHLNRINQRGFTSIQIENANSVQILTLTVCCEKLCHDWK